MPKLNAVLMVVLAVGVIAGIGVLALRPAPAQEIQPAQVQKLLRKLGDPDPDIRREGETGLRQAGPASIAPLREAAHSPNRVLADRASKLLQELTAGPAPAPDNSIAKPAPTTE